MPELIFGINADPFSWQLEALGLPIPPEHELYDLDAKALMRVLVRGLIPAAIVQQSQRRLARNIIRQVRIIASSATDRVASDPETADKRALPIYDVESLKCVVNAAIKWRYGTRATLHESKRLARIVDDYIENHGPDVERLNEAPCVFKIGSTTCGYSEAKHRCSGDGTPMNHSYTPTAYAGKDQAAKNSEDGNEYSHEDDRDAENERLAQGAE